MTRTPKVIAPRASEPMRSSTGTGGLPDELLDEQLRRLRLCAAVAMGLWTFGLVMDIWVRPGTVGPLRRVEVVLVAQRPPHALCVVQPGVGRADRRLHLSALDPGHHGLEYVVMATAASSL